MSGTQNTVAVVVGALALLALGVGIGVVVAPMISSDPKVIERTDETLVPVTVSQVPHPGRDFVAPLPASPAAAAAEPPRTRPERRPRIGDDGLTAEQVRRIVAEELARFDREGAGRPPPPDPADPELNADAQRRAAVKEAVLGLRHVVVANSMKYKMGFGEAARLRRPDPSLVDLLGDERVWPSNNLGFIERDAERYEILGAGAEGFDPTREEGAWVFTERLGRNVATEHAVSLVFEQGIGTDAVVTLQGGGAVGRCSARATSPGSWSWTATRP